MSMSETETQSSVSSNTMTDTGWNSELVPVISDESQSADSDETVVLPELDSRVEPVLRTEKSVAGVLKLLKGLRKIQQEQGAKSLVGAQNMTDQLLHRMKSWTAQQEYFQVLSWLEDLLPRITSGEYPAIRKWIYENLPIDDSDDDDENLRDSLDLEESRETNFPGSSYLLLGAGDDTIDLPHLPDRLKAMLHKSHFRRTIAVDRGDNYLLKVAGRELFFPYEAMMQPQEQIAEKVFQALDASKHCMLESPTGTGKTLALLCSVLAWVIEHQKQTGERLPVYWSTRTHSQMSQVVKELRRTAYRPRVASMVSRRKMCPFSAASRGGAELDTWCHEGVMHAEKLRKRTEKTSSGSQEARMRQSLQTVPEALHTSSGSCPFYANMARPEVAAFVAERFMGACDIHVDADVDQTALRGLSREGTCKSDWVWDIEDICQSGATGKNFCSRAPDVGADLPPLGDATPRAKPTKSTRTCVNCDSAHAEPSFVPPKAIVKGNVRLRPRMQLSASTAAFCPYYAANALARVADLTILPYNSLLMPQIRVSKKINLADAIIVVDEAHNLEDFCCSEGSSQCTLEDIKDFLSWLFLFACYGSRKGYDKIFEKRNPTPIHDFWATCPLAPSESFLTDGNAAVSAAMLFLALERMFCNLTSKVRKATNSVFFKNRLQTQQAEFTEVSKWCAATHGFEAGCGNFFRELGTEEENSVDKLEKNIDHVRNAFFQLWGKGERQGEDRSGVNRILNAGVRVVSHLDVLVKSMGLASAHPNAYTISVLKSKEGGVQLSFRLEFPGILFRKIAEKSRSIILASGTLSPVDSMVTELSSAFSCRLLPPLEANHVVSPYQFQVAIVKSLIDGRDCKCVKANLGSKDFLLSLVASIITFSSRIVGGMLVFFPSYATLQDFHTFCARTTVASLAEALPVVFEECRRLAPGRNRSLLDVLTKAKKRVFLEARGSAEFETQKREYQSHVSRHRNALLLAVYRGKMSEGMDFADDLARAVICVGLPLPSFADTQVTNKKLFNEALLNNRIPVSIVEAGPARPASADKWLSGDAWYHLQAYRALNQAVGRCVRHPADKGFAIFLESRLALPVHRSNLARWIDKHIVDGNTCQEVATLLEEFQVNQLSYEKM